MLEANGEGDPEEQGGQNHAWDVGEPLSHEVGEGLQPSRALSKVVDLDRRTKWEDESNLWKTRQTLTRTV